MSLDPINIEFQMRLLKEYAQNPEKNISFITNVVPLSEEVNQFVKEILTAYNLYRDYKKSPDHIKFQALALLSKKNNPAAKFYINQMESNVEDEEEKAKKKVTFWGENKLVGGQEKLLPALTVPSNVIFLLDAQTEKVFAFMMDNEEDHQMTSITVLFTSQSDVERNRPGKKRRTGLF